MNFKKFFDFQPLFVPLWSANSPHTGTGYGPAWSVFFGTDFSITRSGTFAQFPGIGHATPSVLSFCCCCCYHRVCVCVRAQWTEGNQVLFGPPMPTGHSRKAGTGRMFITVELQNGSLEPSIIDSVCAYFAFVFLCSLPSMCAVCQCFDLSFIYCNRKQFSQLLAQKFATIPLRHREPLRGTKLRSISGVFVCVCVHIHPEGGFQIIPCCECSIPTCCCLSWPVSYRFFSFFLLIA